MSTESGHDFLLRMRAGGHSDDEIREALRASGWADSDIDALFASLARPPELSSGAASAASSGGKKLLVLAAVILIAILIAPSIAGRAYKHMRDTAAKEAQTQRDLAAKAAEARLGTASKVTELHIPADSQGKSFNQDGVATTVSEWRTEGGKLKITVEFTASPLPGCNRESSCQWDYSGVVLLAADGRKVGIASLRPLTAAPNHFKFTCTFRLQGTQPIVPKALLITIGRSGRGTF